MVSKITNWFGRLGNNIQQISNAIYYCNEKRVDFSFLEHPVVENFNLNFGKDDGFRSRFFFYSGTEKDFECNLSELNSKRREICVEHIKPMLKIPEVKAFGEDTLVVHLRGGDVFARKPPSTYVQNPLSYYQKIMARYDKVIVVSEDTSNPLLEALMEDGKVTIQSSSVEEDFSTLMAAKNLASSGVGTFCIAAALCSTNLQNFYASDIFCDEHLNPDMLSGSDIDVNIIKVPDYIKIGEWKNSQEQVSKMMEYEF
jgi:hypothetical protein